MGWCESALWVFVLFFFCFAIPGPGSCRAAARWSACERLSAFLWSGRGRCGDRGRDVAQQELRPPGCVSVRKVNAIGRKPPTREAPRLARQWSAGRLHPNNPLTPQLLQLVHGQPHQGISGNRKTPVCRLETLTRMHVSDADFQCEF